jgi:hypothetical protein
MQVRSPMSPILRARGRGTEDPNSKTRLVDGVHFTSDEHACRAPWTPTRTSLQTNQVPAIANGLLHKRPPLPGGGSGIIKLYVS